MVDSETDIAEEALSLTTDAKETILEAAMDEATFDSDDEDVVVGVEEVITATGSDNAKASTAAVADTDVDTVAVAE